MRRSFHSHLLAAVLGVASANAQTDCVAVSQTLGLEVSAETSKVLEIVSKHAGASPDCACEVVKSAIKSSKADAETVAAIVESAIIAAPQQSRIIVQCAIATAPDAATAIHAVMARLDRNSGDSARSSKSGKEVASETAEEPWNPLDIPKTDDPPPTDGPRPPGPPPLRGNPDPPVISPPQEPSSPNP